MNRTKLAAIALVALLALISAGAGSATVGGPGTVGEHYGGTPDGDAVVLPEVASAGWWATAQEDIRHSEYHVTWQDSTYLPDVPAAYQAPNRAQGLRTYFTPDGLRIIPRTEVTPSWDWGLTLRGYDYEGDVQPVAAPTVDGNRIEYLRGNVTEWYVNDEAGIQHAFRLETAPPFPLSVDDGEGAMRPAMSHRQPGGEVRAPLRIDLTLSGDVAASLAEDGRGITLAAVDGRAVLLYGSLEAVDTAGKQLPALLSLSGSTLSILVDDADGVYPIMFSLGVSANGLSATADWTAEGDQAGASLGISVGTAGDVDGDGYSDVVVGAYFYDNGEPDEGRAFVYQGSASGLSPAAGWTAESNQALAYFGVSVGTAGDVNGDGYSDVIVGAHFYDNGQADEGAAFVYHGSASGLSAAAGWTAESDQALAYFGISVGTAGDVNADGYSDVVIGAIWLDNGQTDEGAALVYHGSASGLSATADWTAESDQAGAEFGNSVGTAGDVNGDGYSDVIVGANAHDGGQSDEGAAFVYHGSASGLSPAPDWTAESDQEVAFFGISVGMAGDVNGDGYSDVIVGAWLYNNVETNEGRAFVYHGSASGLSATAGWTADSNQGRAYFGWSVGTAGDVNGDGYADVIIGAFNYDNGQIDEGRAFVYHGSSSGLSTTPDWSAESDQVLAYFGISVGTAGDVNADGYSDVIVGAIFYDNSEPDEGQAFVYLGSGAAPSTPVPGLSGWGLIAMAGAMAAAVLWRLGRRRYPSSEG